MIVEWVLIVAGTFAAIRAFARLTSGRSWTSITDSVILALWGLNCLPVLLDQLVGTPKHVAWFSRLLEAREVEWVRAYYAAYVTLVILVLHWHAVRRSWRLEREGLSRKQVSPSALAMSRPGLMWGITLAPYAIAALSGPGRFLSYRTVFERGLPESLTSILTISLLASVMASTVIFFSRKRGVGGLVILVLHLSAIVWIDGKRYLIATIILLLFFAYFDSRAMGQSRVAAFAVVSLMTAAVVALFAFFVWYSGVYKSTDVESLDSVYATLRLDFGRDDVTKFAIFREGDQGSVPILEYPGQGLVGSILMPVPRSIWPDKPLPYYRYLTAAVFGVDVSELHSGITPSVLAMNVSDWGLLFGPLVSFALLSGLCSLGDSERSEIGKLGVLLAIIGLLTQSLDAVLAPLAVTCYVIGRRLLGVPGRSRDSREVDRL